MMVRIGFPSGHVAYRQLVPHGSEALPTGDFAVRSLGCAGDKSSRLTAISFWMGRLGHPHHRGFRLPLTDAAARLVLAARFCVGRVLRDGLARLGAGLSLRAGSGCGLAGWGCVLRTASANILCRSALVGAEGLVILPPFLSNSRLPRRAINLQSSASFSGIPLCLERKIPQQRRAAMKTTD